MDNGALLAAEEERVASLAREPDLRHRDIPAGDTAACTHPLFDGLKYGVGKTPRAIAVGDLDGVNGPDLAMANTASDDVSVLLSQGDGSFAAATAYPAGGRPVSIAIGDLDGVNGPDLAVVNQISDDVSVLFNRGDGTFSAAVPYGGVNASPRSVAIGDLDRINGPDLVVPFGAGVSVLFNQGDGTFAAPVSYFSLFPVSWYHVVIAELDMFDGPDLALSRGFGTTVSVLLNLGDGTFTEPTDWGAGVEPVAITAGDVDGRNGPDLVVNGGFEVSVLLNHGNGSFAPPRTYAADTAGAVALADLDGVNGLDVAVAGDSTAVLLNRGDGTFDAPRTYATGSRGEVVIADFDGAAGPDLAIASSAGDNVAILFNQGAGDFIPLVRYTAGESPAAVALGDLDGGNGPDLAIANRGSDDVAVLLNQGDGTFAAAVAHDVGANPSSIALGDLDGLDGPDLAIANAGSDDVSVLLNQGDGTFSAAESYAAGGGPLSIAVGDLDRINGADLVVASSGSLDVSVLLNQGDGTFASGVSYPIGERLTSVAVGDLDGILGPDLAVTTQVVCSPFTGCPDGNNAVWVLLNQGDGSFAAPTEYAAGSGLYAIAVGDLDGVNGPDLAVANGVAEPRDGISRNAVQVLLNQGDGTFAAAVAYTIRGRAANSLAIADLDGSNGRDVVVVDGGAGDALVLLNRGDGTFCAAESYAAGSGARSVAVGDLDGIDGADLAVAASRSDAVTVLLNRGSEKIQVALDIKPDDWPNSINPHSGGVIPVAILGSETFDVTRVDVASLTFGPGGAAPGHNLRVGFTYDGHLQDVNLDGHLDLVTHYRTRDTGIACGDESATLTGETLDGQPIEGADSIRTVGCHRHPVQAAFDVGSRVGRGGA